MYNKYMSNHSSFEKSLSSPEQKAEASQGLAWDSLTELSESETWDEHLEKANKIVADYMSNRGREPKFQDEVEFVQKMDEYRHGKLEGDVHTIGKTEKFQNQRSQEFFEREINNRLTGLEELDMYSEIEGSGVEKTSINYEGEAILLYHLNNYPIRFIQTALDYKQDFSEDDKKLNQKTIAKMKEVLDDPGVWDTHEADIEITDEDLSNGRRGKSNNISTSYINCGDAESLRRRVNGDCCYGFSHLEGNSVINADMTDIISRSDIGKDDSKLTESKVQRLLADLEHPGESHYRGINGAYNEIVIRRYNENGEPKRPDFMIVQDGNINPTALKHAKYFNIPIININTKTYFYSNETLSKEYTAEQISEKCSDLLAAGADPNFIKSKLSAEDVWQNYDVLKEYIPNLDIEVEFNNLVNDRFANALKKMEGTPTDEEQEQAYSEVVSDIIYGPDAYDYLERGGGEQLLEITHKTGDDGLISYAQEISKYMQESSEQK